MDNGEQKARGATRTFAVKVYAATSRLLAVLILYILVVFILRALAKTPEQVRPFLPLFGVLLVLFVIGAAIATFWSSAARRVWLALLIPPVLIHLRLR